MKFTTLALLVGAAVADQCEPEALHSVIYNDKDCEDVNEELTEKYGSVPKEAYKMLSGKCETTEYKGDEISIMNECSAAGYHEAIWKGDDCEGKPVFDKTFKWGKCYQSLEGEGVYFRAHTKQEFDLIMNAEEDTTEMVSQKGYFARYAQFCTHLYEHYKFGGRTAKFCLNPGAPANFVAVNFLKNFNDLTSSIRLGKFVKGTYYEHNIGKGGRVSMNGPWNNNVPAYANDKISSLWMVNQAKSACVYEHYNLKGTRDCFPYNDNTDFAVYNLAKFGMNDKVSSLYVPAGVQVKLYQHGYNQGLMHTYTGPQAHNVALNDQYSTIKVCREWCKN